MPHLSGLRVGGQVLDATVFEQYKHQGHRTYLPMPFAVVVGGEPGWGYHVATSRRAWYDVGVSHPDRIIVEAAVDPSEAVLRLRIYVGEPASVVSEFLAETWSDETTFVTFRDARYEVHDDGAPHRLTDSEFRPTVPGPIPRR